MKYNIFASLCWVPIESRPSGVEICSRKFGHLVVTLCVAQFHNAYSNFRQNNCIAHDLGTYFRVGNIIDGVFLVGCDKFPSFRAWWICDISSANGQVPKLEDLYHKTYRTKYSLNETISFYYSWICIINIEIIKNEYIFVSNNLSKSDAEFGTKIASSAEFGTILPKGIWSR